MQNIGNISLNMQYNTYKS